MTEVTNKYRLVSGKHHVDDSKGGVKALRAGDNVVLDLTDAQAKSFGDKFVLESVYQANMGSETEATKALEAKIRKEFTEKVRDEIRAELAEGVEAKYKEQVATKLAEAFANGKAEGKAEAAKAKG